jgi:hypothetical protein
MAAYTNTGCFSHPIRLDRSYKCLVCAAILTTGTSDFTSSVYPEINAHTLAGPAAAYFTPQKPQAAPLNIFNSVAKRTILNTFSISKHFHPGQRVENPSDNYSERFAIDDEPTILKVFYISKDYHPGPSAEKKSHYSERFALDSEDEEEIRAPKRRRGPDLQPRRRQPTNIKDASKQLVSSQELEELVERRVAERLQAATTTAASRRRTGQHKSSEFKTKAPEVEEEEVEMEGATIIVESSESEDEDEESIRVRRTGKQSQAVKGNSSDEESLPITRSSGTKRARSASESSDGERPAKKTRSFMAAKSSKCSEKETRSQTKKVNVTLRRSPRGHP